MSARWYAVIVALTLGVGLWLRLPTLDVGFFLDDYAQLSMLQGTYPVPRHPLDLFDFSTGDPDEVRAIVDSGYFPWWTHPELKLALFRPLSSALIWADWTLFGTDPWPYHLHSLLWWVALMVLFSAFAAALVPRPIAATAVALFALDEAHTTLVGWIANRNALVAGSLGVLALWCHLEFRRHGGTGRLLATLLLATAAMLAGEYALCITGYAVAHELVVGRGRRLGARVVGTLPLLVPALAVIGLHVTFGYGSYGSDLYVDPFREPGAFVGALVTRVPVFVADMLWTLRGEWWIIGPPLRDTLVSTGWFSIDTWRLLPSWHASHVALGIVGLAFGVVAVVTTLRALDPTLRPTVSWLALGTVLALIPVAVALPTSRLMVVPLFGFTLTLATVLVVLARRIAAALLLRRRPPVGITLLAVGLAALHFGVAPMHARRDAFVLSFAANAVRGAVLDAEVDPARVSDQHLLVVATRDPQVAIYVCMIRRFHGAPTPKTCRAMSMAHTPHELRRIDDRTLELQTLGGTMLSHLFERTFRTSALPIEPGHRIRLPGVEIEVVQVVRSGVRTIRFTFDHALEDGSVALLHSTWHGLDRLIPPAVGDKTRLVAAPPPLGRRPARSPAIEAPAQHRESDGINGGSDEQ